MRESVCAAPVRGRGAEMRHIRPFLKLARKSDGKMSFMVSSSFLLFYSENIGVER